MKQIRTNKRHQILDVAQRLALEGGFSAMSIDSVIEACNITKGGFFYHFKNKDDLARALIERYAETDLSLLKSLRDRAVMLSEDPLERILLYLKLLEESMVQMNPTETGCLFATYSYEMAHLPMDLKEFIQNTFLELRELFLELLEPASEKYPPVAEVKCIDLADMFIVMIEGGLITARFFEDFQLFPRQIAQYRQYVKLLFPR